MRLNDIAFQADLPPERQPQLRQIPSAKQVDHPALNTALVAYEKARADERAKRQEFAEAEGPELERARRADQEALAAAIEAGKPDPGPKHERKAEERLAQARREHGAARLLLARAIEAVVTAFDRHADAWEASLLEERDRLREQMREKLDEWAALWGQLQINSASRAVARGTGLGQSPSLFADSFKVPLVLDGDVIKVVDVLDGLRGLAAPAPKKAAGAVQSLPVGAEPTRHRLPPGRREERMARADARRAEREERRAAEDAAIEAV